MSAEPTVHLNGEWLPLSQARVPVLDRGFIFGDGVYEVIPVYGRRPFRLPQHLARLARSLEAIRLEPPLDAPGWTALIDELLARNPGGDRSVYLQVTRGPASRDHAFPRAPKPTVFAMVSPLNPPDPALLEKGAAAVVLEDIRWSRCDIKSVNLLANILLRQQAVERGALEAILVRDGLVTEGAASNVFIVRDGEIRTPPTSRFMLPGITRDLVLELARAHGLPCREVPVSEAELRGADEIWITSSTREILPVTRLDGRPVGGGPGHVWRRIMPLYQEYKRSLREAAEA